VSDLSSLRATFGAAFFVLAAGLAARAQNPIVFVGTSTSGSVDSHFFVDAVNGQVVQAGGNTFTNNVTDAVWADYGANLYVAQGLDNRVSRAQWSGASASWSTLWSAPGSCYGLGLDVGRKRLWVLAGPSNSRELHCIDVDTSSANYGQSIASTATLGGVSRERWALSDSGNRAVVPHVFLQSGLLEVVDTDPSSASFLQVIISIPAPSAANGFSFSSSCALTPDDQHAIVLYVGIGTASLAVLHMPTATLLDFDALAPGQQDLVLVGPNVPNRMALLPDGARLVLSAQGGGGSAWAVDLDFSNPGASTLTPYLANQGLLPAANGASRSRTGSLASFSATPVFLQGPSYLVTVDTATGALISNVTLPNAWNVYTTAWQDSCLPPRNYCTAGVTTNGCAATMSAAGLASASAPSGFTLSALGVEGDKQGLIFYSASGEASSPWGASSSFLCIKAPTQRTGAQVSGGAAGSCNGVLSVDWNAFRAANPTAVGTPFAAGDRVQAQAWFRDPPSPKSTMLSDALEFEVCP